ncbi:uncharacterized protein VTP21DRAFT_3086 [Calcarisporiella thermophila]|uniref:uncharacterized protein n=1 Tax=Calcarisporiella thermophila TaxID=911321 RepID=UPI003743E3A9
MTHRAHQIQKQTPHLPPWSWRAPSRAGTASLTTTACLPKEGSEGEFNIEESISMEMQSFSPFLFLCRDILKRTEFHSLPAFILQGQPSPVSDLATPFRIFCAVLFYSVSMFIC